MPNVGDVKKIGLLVAAIVVTGLVFKYAGDLPVIKDAKNGFGG